MNLKKGKQIENLLVAQAMILDLPNRKFTYSLNLSANDAMLEKGPNHCGSAACFGGWVAVHPHFQAQGVRARKDDGSPMCRGLFSSLEISQRLFGDSSMFKSGTRFWSGPSQEKREVLARIKDALEEVVYD